MQPAEPRHRPPTAVDEEALEELAAEWLARRDAGFADAERAQFERWLAADPRHARAVAAIEAAWAVVNQPRLAGQAEALQRELFIRGRNRQRRQRNRVLAFSTAGLAAAAALVVVFISPRPEPSVVVPPVSISVRPERKTLADGSVVELNAGAEIGVDFSSARRGVRLLRGEAHFAVTHDAARPFIVSAGGIETRAVGTAFAVRYGAGEVDVLVTEGKVAVAHTPEATPPAGSAPPLESVLVMAGAKLTMPVDPAGAVAPRVRQVTPAEMARALAWRGNRVEFSGTSLFDAVALFNRQNQLQLSLGDRSLEDLRVSGIFWTDDPAGFTRLLEASFGIKAEHENADRIVLRRSQ